MPKSWNHRIEPITDDERRMKALAVSHCGGGGNCPERPTHWISFDCVRGQKGNVGTSRRPCCDKHTRMFAEKSGVEMPALV
jgi:hypothetical protein